MSTCLGLWKRGVIQNEHLCVFCFWEIEIASQLFASYSKSRIFKFSDIVYGIYLLQLLFHISFINKIWPEIIIER